MRRTSASLAAEPDFTRQLAGNGCEYLLIAPIFRRISVISTDILLNIGAMSRYFQWRPMKTIFTLPRTNLA
jgi:hypothetical protein